MALEQHKFRYNLEAQAGIIHRSQWSKKRLRSNEISFEGSREYTEDNQQWIDIGKAKYPKNNINENLLSQVKPGDKLVEVLDIKTEFKSDNGEELFPVAALLFNGQPVYMSPVFNLERYLKRQRKLK